MFSKKIFTDVSGFLPNHDFSVSLINLCLLPELLVFEILLNCSLDRNLFCFLFFHENLQLLLHHLRACKLFTFWIQLLLLCEELLLLLEDITFPKLFALCEIFIDINKTHRRFFSPFLMVLHEYELHNHYVFIFNIYIFVFIIKKQEIRFSCLFVAHFQKYREKVL